MKNAILLLSFPPMLLLFTLIISHVHRHKVYYARLFKRLYFLLPVLLFPLSVALRN